MTVKTRETSWRHGLAAGVALALAACGPVSRDAGLSPNSEGLPAISLSKPSVAFTAVLRGTAPAEIVAISNAGGGTLGGLSADVEYTDGSDGWLTASLSSTTGPTTISIQAAGGPLPPGLYTGRVKLTATGASNSPQYVKVAFNLTQGSIPAVINLSSTAVNISIPVGAANPPPTIVLVTNGGEDPLSGLSIDGITYGAGPEGWLAVSLASTDAPTNFLVQPNLGGLALGSYTATISLSAPNAINSPRTIRVTLNVIPPVNPPVIALSASSASFAAPVGGTAGAKAINITNGGGGTLSNLAISGISYGAGATGWLAATVSTSMAPSVLTLAPTVGSLAAGTYTATVTLSAAGASNSPQPFPVTLTVTPATANGTPKLVLSTTSVTFSGFSGGAAPTPQSSFVTNGGSGTLSGLALGAVQYDPGATGWLTVTLNATTAPAYVTFRPSVAQLQPGYYTASISLSAPGADDSPKTLKVSISVAPSPNGPSILLAPASLSYQGILGNPSPPAQTVSLTNGGTGTLNGLSVGTIIYSGGATGWLAAALNSTTAPATLTVTPTLGSLAAGTYTATVPIFSGTANNSPRNVSVTFTVLATPPPPTIVLSPATIGFNGTVGAGSPTAKTVALSNGGGGTVSGIAVGTITYGPGATAWLAASLSTPTAPSTLTLTATTGSLAVGTYTAIVPITSSTASNSPQNVSVTFTVAAAPAPSIGLSPTNLSFAGTVGGGSPAAKTVSITNSGTGTLTGLSVGAIAYGAGGTGWLAVVLNSTNAPASVTVTPSVGSLATGSYTATIPIVAAGATNSPQNVTITFTITATAPPTIALSAATLTYGGTAGGSSPAPQTVNISNSGGGTLSALAVGTITYGAGASGWLAGSLNITSAPSTLTLTATLGSLAVGSYTATVPVTAAGASNSPQNVSVTFTVAAASPPMITLSAATITFSGTAGGTSPAAKTINITNSGGGTLSGLTVGTITYSAGATGWLAGSLNPTTAPSTLTLTPTLGTLAAGTYTATVPITAAGASNSPQNEAVTFTVAAGGGLSFKTDIYPIFQANCLGNSCHSNGNQSPDLTTVANAYKNLVGTTGAGTKYVTPGNPAVGKLTQRMTDANNPMPPNGLLSSTVVNKIKAWITQGAPNN